MTVVKGVCTLGVTGMILLLLCNPCSSLKVLVTPASLLHSGVLDALGVGFRDGDFLIVHP